MSMHTMDKFLVYINCFFVHIAEVIYMSIKYKIDVMQALKDKGYSSYYLMKNKIFGQATMTKFRHKGQLNFNDLNKLCTLLQCQPGDILEYVPDDNDINIKKN